jgi:hypothetical protein
VSVCSIALHCLVLSLTETGFSQGGALSLYSGLRASTPFAGVLCMSGTWATACTNPHHFFWLTPTSQLLHDARALVQHAEVSPIAVPCPLCRVLAVPQAPAANTRHPGHPCPHAARRRGHGGAARMGSGQSPSSGWGWVYAYRIHVLPRSGPQHQPGGDQRRGCVHCTVSSGGIGRAAAQGVVGLRHGFGEALRQQSDFLDEF